MIIYAAAVFSCVTLGKPDGQFSLLGPQANQSLDGSYTKHCEWKVSWQFWVHRNACEQSLPKPGAPIYSDVMDGRTVEIVECREIPVYE